MSDLFSEFVNYYASTCSNATTRRLIDASWEGIDRSDEISALKDYMFSNAKGIHFLNANLSPRVNNKRFHLKFAGVFCHKKPTIQRSAASKQNYPGNTPGCELGDLLTIFVLLDANDKLHHLTGSLFQAKVHQKLDSVSQRRLYDCDGDYILPANLGGHTRSLPTYAEGRARALRYLILNPDRPNTFVSCRHTPWDADYQPRWSTYLDALLAGSEGLTARTHNMVKNSSWSTLVDDLLSVAAKVPSRKPPRGTDVAVQIATGQFNDFSAHDIWNAESQEPGVSVLMAIAHQHAGDVVA